MTYEKRTGGRPPVLLPSQNLQLSLLGNLDRLYHAVIGVWQSVRDVREEADHDQRSRLDVSHNPLACSGRLASAVECLFEVLIRVEVHCGRCAGHISFKDGHEFFFSHVHGCCAGGYEVWLGADVVHSQDLLAAHYLALSDLDDVLAHGVRRA